MTEQNCERYTDIYLLSTLKNPGPCVTLFLVLGISCDREIVYLIFDLREIICLHCMLLKLVVVKSNDCNTQRDMTYRSVDYELFTCKSKVSL